MSFGDSLLNSRAASPTLAARRIGDSLLNSLGASPDLASPRELSKLSPILRNALELPENGP